MKKKFERLKFNFDKNRKNALRHQISKLNNYIAGSRAIEIFCNEIIRKTENPFIKDDPEAILISLKDFCEERLKFAIDEKTKAHTELTALRKLSKISNDEYYEEDLPGFKPLY
jgi:hypothetical protein